jgi:hypothetical protein
VGPPLSGWNNIVPEVAGGLCVVAAENFSNPFQSISLLDICLPPAHFLVLCSPADLFNVMGLITGSPISWEALPKASLPSLYPTNISYNALFLSISYFLFNRHA